MNSEKPDSSKEKLDKQDVASMIAALENLAETDQDAFIEMVTGAFAHLPQEHLEELLQAAAAEGAKKKKKKPS